MSDAGAPTGDVQNASIHRGSAVVLAVGFGLSLTAHLGIGYGASEYFARTRVLDSELEKTIEADASALSPMPDEIRLGLDESKVASINWLGVLEDEQVGDVHEALVEQAEFTQQLGDAPITRAPEPRIEPKPEVIQDVVQEVVEPVEIPIEEPVEELVKEPVKEALEKVLSEQIELEIKDEIEDAMVIITQPEPIEMPVEEAVEEAVEEPVKEPSEESIEEPIEEIVQEPVEQIQPAADPTPKAQEVTPTTAGKVGIVSPKESAASKIKRALKVDGRNLHRPIAGAGIEMITVEPRFPASVRFTELPSNPVVMIQFDATGKVRKAYFLRDGVKVYDTGVKGVDEPLLNAIYKWRAKGKEIESLDADDPKSFVEISMRITFRKDRKKEP